jgi:hypothetical protein
MAALALFYKTHFGDYDEVGTLSSWIDFLQRDAGKLWNNNDATHVQDYNACLDFFEVLLNGYIIAALCESIDSAAASARTFSTLLPTLPSDVLQRAIASLADLASNPSEVIFTESDTDGETREGHLKTSVFIKHALLLKTFHAAVKVGDTGLMLNALKFLSIWFQGSQNYKYAAECLRLTACLEGGIWSDRLSKFWMENMVVNLSGKKSGFIALDMLNEYIVREVKTLIPDNLTPSTDNRVRNICSLLIMKFREIRKHISTELEVKIFDHHSKRVNPWRDSIAVANRLIAERIHRTPAGVESNRVSEDSIMNLYVYGLEALASGQGIARMKERWLAQNDFDVGENDDESDTDGRSWSGCEDSSDSD